MLKVSWWNGSSSVFLGTAKHDGESFETCVWIVGYFFLHRWTDPHLGEGVKGRQGSPGLGQQPLQDEDNLWSGGAPGAGKSYHNGSPGGIIQLPQLFQGGHSAQSLANHQSKNEYRNILILLYYLSECLGNFGSHSRGQRGPGPSVCQRAEWPD